MTVALFAGLVALLVVIVAKRPARDLGSVSDKWIAQHRVDVTEYTGA